MPADSPSSPGPSGSSGRSRPNLSDLARETTESDLWNLDDDAAGASPSMPATTRRRTPAPEGSKGSARTERPWPQPARAEEPPASDAEVVTLGAGTTPSAPSAAPERRTRDAFEDLSDIPEAREPSPPEAVEEVPAPAAAPATPETPAEEKESAPEEEKKPAAAAVEPAEKEKAPRAAAPAVALPRLNRREWIGIAAFAVVAAIAALWAVSRFFSEFTFAPDSMEMPDFPVKGEQVVVGNAEPFWREPVRTGDNRDVARREVTMIPVLELTLKEGSRGTLRAIFRNGQGEPVGDSISRTLSAASHDGNGEVKVEFPATDGFTSDGNFHAYRTGMTETWTADVLEGPADGDSTANFKKILTVPLLPLRR